MTRRPKKIQNITSHKARAPAGGNSRRPLFFSICFLYSCLVEDNVKKIKDRLDIVEVISPYVKLQKAGINYKGRCPFHNEKTPSFFVTPERQIWHCFGCAKGGDMFEFIKEIEGVEFPEALKMLAAKAGVELPAYRPSAAEYGAKDTKTKLYEICELATKFFEKQFQSTTGKKALAYLTDRGLTAATIKEFRLGFAPNDWEALSQFLQLRGYTETEIVEAGMAIRRDESKGRGKGIYDRFRSRIMFPIFDISGQTVGFTGRVFEVPKTGQELVGDNPIDSDQVTVAKYINTPGTLIYDKSRILYGLSKAKLEIKRADRCILVEGNMDALMSYQAGVQNVVATSGTALTPHHLRLLQRYTKNLGFCFDSDQAGAAATKRGIGLALAGQFNIRVLELTDRECKDPADYVQKHGAGWIDAVSAAKPVIDYYFDRARKGYNPTSAESKKSIITAVAPFIKRLASEAEYAHWIGQLALLLEMPPQSVNADIVSFKDDLDTYIEQSKEPAMAVATAPVVEPLRPREVPDMMNEALLSVVLCNPELFQTELNALPYELLNPQTAETLRRISTLPQPFSFAELVAGYPEEDVLPLEFAHLRSQELWQGFSEEQLKTEFATLLVTIRRRAVNARLTQLQFDVREAESAKDSARLEILSREFQDLVRQLIPVARITTHNAQKEITQKVAEKESSEEKVDPSSEETFQETGQEGQFSSFE